MKWIIKKRLFVALIVAIILAGCEHNSPNAENSGDSSSSAIGIKSNDIVNLVWFSDTSFWKPPSPWNLDPNTVEGEISKKTGLAFNFNIPVQDAVTKLSLMIISSGKLPDIMSVVDESIIKMLVKSGKVWNLDELLQEYDPTSSLLSSFPEDIKKALIKRDGGWFAYPSHMSSSDSKELYPPTSEIYADSDTYRNNLAIMFNKQIMEQAGIDISDLETEDGVLSALKKVQGMSYQGSKVIPLQIDGIRYSGINIGERGHLGTLGTLELMFGAMPVDKAWNYRDIILAPEMKHAIDFLYKAAKDGDFDPNQMTIDKNAVFTAIKSGRVFAFIGNTADTGFSDEDAANNWVSPGPVFSNQHTKPVLGMTSKPGWWLSTFISKSAQNPERIAKWLNFMTSDEGMKLHYFGFEGVDYTLDASGLVVKNQQGLQNAANYETTGVFGFWPFHNMTWHNHVTVPSRSEKGADGLEAIQVQTAFGKEAKIYDTTALFMPDNLFEAGSALANLKLQMQAYLEAQISKMVLAKDEPSRDDIYENTISTLKEMGLNEINAKVNEQFQIQQKELGTSLRGINS